MPQIILSAQNFDIYDSDGQDPVARTGAISIEMLDRAGAEGVILGHSEVNDSPEMINKKLLSLVQRKASKKNLLTYTTVLVGESWDEFKGKTTEKISQILTQKLKVILKDIPEDFIKNIVVGYEPKWGSRGSGHDDVSPPSPEFISVCAKQIKLYLVNTFGEIGKQIPIIYGGRSSPQRTEQILADENVAGLILGSACNTVQKTLDIAQAMERTMGKRKKILHANFKAFNLPDSYEKYIEELRKLNDRFVIYLSPCYTDIREVNNLLR